MSALFEKYMQYFVLDKNPEYMLVDNGLLERFQDLSPEQFSNLIEDAFDQHKTLWESRGHKYE